jgi:hypothetical protein
MIEDLLKFVEIPILSPIFVNIFYLRRPLLVSGPGSNTWPFPKETNYEKNFYRQPTA